METGAIGRFARVGPFASDGRCVGRETISNGKKHGHGNIKNGNTYLAWACVEAAHVAVRDTAPIQRFFARTKAKTTMVVARKAVAHKRCRACSSMRRNRVAFDLRNAFGPPYV